MSLRVYNTLTGRKEDFVERDRGRVAMYVCGPTVHDYIHIGNARTFLTFDVIRRYLLYKGYQVLFVQNITDVEDKIINKARQLGLGWQEVAQKFEREFYQDMEKLGIMPADVQPRATEQIDFMIKMISTLEEKGYAYRVDGDVYFSISQFKEYGQLSKRNVDEMMARSRVEVDQRKRHPLDFALWKSSKAGEPRWDSPWGMGRPGWHIECSAMSLNYLGFGFDIHGGAQDLIFPHHENEIAQAEGYRQEKPFVRYWLHGGMLQINEEEMHKSLGNFVTVHELLEKENPNVVRLLMLGSHYRSGLNFTEEKLEEARKAYGRMAEVVSRLNFLSRQAPKEAPHSPDLSVLERALYETRPAFEEAMDDDFNTARALSTVFELIRLVNSLTQSSEFVLTSRAREVLTQARELIMELGGVLGLKFEEGRAVDQNRLSALVDLLLEIREEARSKRDWQLADRIRDGLSRQGIMVEDRPDGPIWKIKSDVEHFSTR